jgi:hypothetical protein
MDVSGHVQYATYSGTVKYTEETSHFLLPQLVFSRLDRYRSITILQAGLGFLGVIWVGHAKLPQIPHGQWPRVRTITIFLDIQILVYKSQCCVGHGFESQGEMVNICTDFNLSNKTSHVTNIDKLLPVIYISSPASPASSKLVNVIQCVSCCQLNVKNNK